MGFMRCFPKVKSSLEENKNERIFIVYTDITNNNETTVFSSGRSLQEVENYLEGTPTVKTVSKRELAEFCQVNRERRGDNLRKEVQHTKSRKYSEREWLTFLSVCMVMATNISVVHAFGTLFPFILSTFGESRAGAATVQSLLFGVGLCSGFIVGSFVQHFGCRLCGIVGSSLFAVGFMSSYYATSTVYLVLSCGIVSGAGFSFLTISSNSAASLCFDGQARLIGLSVVSSAIGVGGMAYPYLFTLMVDLYGIRGTFLLMGGITLNCIPMALLWKDPNKRYSSQTQIQSNSRELLVLIRQMLGRVKETVIVKPFVITVLAFALALPSVTMFEILSIDILESKGLARSMSVTMFIVLNAVSIPGRLIPGFIKHIHGLNSLMAPILGTIVSGLGMILMTTTDTVAGSSVACAALGLSKGILLSSVQIIVIELLDNARFSVGLGMIFGLVGLSTTALGPLNGFIRDTSGSYTLTLYSATATMAISLVLFCASMMLSNKMKAKKNEQLVSIFTVTRL